MWGPESASWRRRSGGIVMTMAKARAALLQIAHPKIAQTLRTGHASSTCR